MKSIRLPPLLFLVLTTHLWASDHTARWIGVTNGEWNDASNWDIGQVPNNTATETYDVVWDVQPVTVKLTGKVVIRNFSLASGGMLSGPFPQFDFTIQGEFKWSQGVLAVAGQTIVEGTAALKASAADPLIQDAGTLVLRGHTDLRATLKWLKADKLVIDNGAVLEAYDGSGIIGNLSRSFARIENRGKFRVLDGTTPFPCFAVHNTGLMEVGARTVEFPTNPGLGLSQEGGRLALAGGIIHGSVSIEPGELAGEGYVQETAVFEGRISGRLGFDHLDLVEAISTFELRGAADGSHDRFNVDRLLNLDGQIEIRLANGFLPGPNDVFTILTAGNGVSGRFREANFTPINFGGRVRVTGSNGTFLLQKAFDSKSVVLRDFVGGPVSLGPGALVFFLPTPGEDAGGCYLAPGAVIDLPDGNWSGGSLEVIFTSGFHAGVDALGLVEGGGLLVTVQQDGQRLVSFRGSTFATAQVSAGQVTCTFNASASNDHIVALLGRLQYRNSELRSGWFHDAADRYPTRTLQVTLTDSLGVPRRLTPEVQFPFLSGTRLGEPLFLIGETVLSLHGDFSNGQSFPVPQLTTIWSSDCHEVNDSAVNDSPGVRNVGFTRGAEVEEYCCVLTARSGLLTAHQVLFADDLFESNLCAIRAAAKAAHCSAPTLRRATTLGNATASPALSLATFYALQSLMRETSEGRRLADLYAQYTGEVVRIVFADQVLHDQMVDVLKSFQPAVSALLAGHGVDITITQSMVDELDMFWDGLINRAGPGLRTALMLERARFDRSQRFVGSDFSDWAHLLAIPAPTAGQPWCFISNVTRADDQFSLEINEIPGTDFSLWRSLDLLVWEPVPQAGIVRGNFTLRFTDPDPGPGKRFYQIRR